MSDPVIPVTQGASPMPQKHAIWIAGIVLVIVLILIGASFLRIGGDTLWHRVLAAAELKGILIVDRSYDSISVHRFGITGPKEQVITVEGELSDYAREGGHEAAIVRTAEGRDVMLLGKNGRAVTSDGSMKAGLALSSDGKFLAYSVATSSPSDGLAPAELSAWTMHLVLLEDGTDMELAQGFGAQFFEHEGKTWFLSTSAEGISVYNTETLQGFVTPFSLVDRVEHTVKIAPDGSRIAIRNTANQQFGLYDIYRLNTTQPLGLSPTNEDLIGLMDVILTRNAVYGTDSWDAGAEGGITILRVPYGSTEEGEYLYTFPADRNYRLVQ